jgi:predicted metal-dependent phosphoesterase TrpH
MIDLHTHSICSDGTTTPAENVALAVGAGLSGLALTDHDTLAGWVEAAAACERLGLEFVPGIELSTEDNDLSVHVLGYWVDPGHAALAEECARLRDERADRAARILDKLAALGLSLDPAAVAAHAGDAPIGRPHIAKAMVDAGFVGDLGTAFQDYLADGGPAWVVKHALSPEKGVALIRAAGGVAVLAHPGSTAYGVADETLVDRLCAAGLAGLEADHAGHDAETVEHWRKVAVLRDLVVTGASDFHGDGKDVLIGARTTSADVVKELRERAAPVAAGGREPW